MRHITGLITPARALHRVLVLELANATAKSRSNALLLSSPVLPSQAARTQCSLPRRLFSSTPAPHKAPSKVSVYDMDIPYHWVRVADENGVLSEPQVLMNVVVGLPEGHRLLMVAPPPESASAESPDSPVAAAAICRIENTALRRQLEKEAAMRKKLEKSRTKTLEINWSIANNDLLHKTGKIKGFLGKGLIVEVLLARKKGARPPAAGEPEALIDKIREAALSVQGAKEFRKMDGRVGGMVTMFFEGPKVAKKLRNKDKYRKDEDGDGDVDVDANADANANAENI
ncbi:hypothetical protein RRF57_003109 [Xylaria bambusicola]|uniref:Translation initiation factor 3 N-terminal domain-containing protein n=1 Tax=Xylaria bambusicola TaxID=326684 RepID=A0AAN7UTS6_9PEZI